MHKQLTENVCVTVILVCQTNVQPCTVCMVHILVVGLQQS